MSLTDCKHYNLTLAFLITVSIFGLILSIFFVVNPSSVEDDFKFRNLTVGSTFIAVCVLGIFAGVFPSLSARNLSFEKRNEYSQSANAIHETTLRAHHPSCENFSTHILKVGNMKFCATCSGLIFGAVIVIFGTCLHFFGNFYIGEPFILVSLGTFAVISSLLQSALPKFSGGLTRFFTSTIFVIGCFLMLVSINEVTKNTSIELFFVALCVLWIFTKIALSQRDHQQTCLNCSIESCRRYKKGKC
jgi:hypothetical protein